AFLPLIAGNCGPFGRAFPRWLATASPGVWRACRRAKVRLRTIRARQYSPDPAYTEKRDRVLAVLREVAAAPDEVVAIFLDEMGYCRWPEPTRSFALAAPVPPPQTTPAGKGAKHRIAGMVDAWSGRVLRVDGHSAGTERLIRLYRKL